MLSFRWAWDNEPDVPPLVVTVRARAIAGGARLVVEHGPYGAANRATAAGHPGAGEARERELPEGWEFFLPRLARLLAAGG